jgi:thioredoxin reductase
MAAIINAKCNSAFETKIDLRNMKSPTDRSFGLWKEEDLRARNQDNITEIDIAIVGGGPLGTSLACHFQRDPILRDKFVIFEKSGVLLADFFSKIKSIGQKVMRSSYDQHLGPDGSLQMVDFARLHYSQLTDFEKIQVKIALSAQRAIVPTDVFIGHSVHMVKIHGLTERAVEREIVAIERNSDDGKWRLIDREGKSVVAKSIVLANGSSYSSKCEVFEESLRKYPEFVSLAFSHSSLLRRGSRVGIVGSGLTAAHLIFQCLEHDCKPTWILRSEAKFRCADFNTSFFRTEGICHFQNQDQPNREKILEDANRGSIMLEFIDELHRLEETGEIDVERCASITQVSKNTSLCLTLSSGKVIDVDALIVATGLRGNCDLMEPFGNAKFSDKTLECETQPGLFAAGPLAMNSIGPAAKNIDGARHASQRILPAIKNRLFGTPLIPYVVRGTFPVSERVLIS